ncbi:hypothetical protein ONZ45_g10561 [Pleurotus djamor]|nr:hypothetical protein ONZ45_g10561 [Pleurotus djamor]
MPRFHVLDLQPHPFRSVSIPDGEGWRLHQHPASARLDPWRAIACVVFDHAFSKHKAMLDLVDSEYALRHAAHIYNVPTNEHYLVWRVYVPTAVNVQPQTSPLVVVDVFHACNKTEKPPAWVWMTPNEVRLSVQPRIRLIEYITHTFFLLAFNNDQVAEIDSWCEGVLAVVSRTQELTETTSDNEDADLTMVDAEGKD